MEHILSLSYGKDSLACLGAIEELGLPLGDLAIRYFIAGIIMCAIRGYITQGIYMHLTAAESVE